VGRSRVGDSMAAARAATGDTAVIAEWGLIGTSARRVITFALTSIWASPIRLSLPETLPGL
jgi:hypothetical protein